MQRASDREILSALGYGERSFGWDEWFGDVEGADYLTDRGKQAARQATIELTQFFGDGWLSRAIEPGPDGAAVPILGIVEYAGDPGHAVPGQPLGEDPRHLRRRLRVGRQAARPPAWARFGCGPASASRYP
jgi:hypothetical protein